MASSSSGHLHPQVLPRPLVDVVGDGDGGGHLAEVGDDAAVEAGEALGAPDVAEEAEHVRLLGGQVEVLAGLALQLGAHQRQRVGGHLPAAAAERPGGQQRERGQRRVARRRVLRQVLPLQGLQNKKKDSLLLHPHLVLLSRRPFKKVEASE